MADKTYTEAEVKALLAKANKPTSTDIEEIAKRPYHTIVSADGLTLCVPPSPGGGGGPLTLNGEHPDDYYAVEEQDDKDKGGKKYVATQNA